MKCNEASLKISSLPKAELTFAEKQKVLKHLQVCSDCKKEYHDYLRIFYLIDKQIDEIVPENIIANFSSDIQNKIGENDNKIFSNKKIIWMAAAAVILFFILNNPLQEFKHTGSTNRLDNISMTELIKSNNWNSVLSKIEKDEIQEELIPVSLLLSKIDNIDSDLANNTLMKKFGTNIEVNRLMNMLLEYQRYNEGISTLRIANYLKSKKGVTS